MNYSRILLASLFAGIASLSMQPNVLAQSEELKPIILKLNNGTLTEVSIIVPPDNVRQSLSWTPEGGQPVNLLEREIRQSSDPMWTLDSGYADNNNVSLIRTGKTGSSEYWHFQKNQEKWELTSKAIIHVPSAGVSNIEFQSPTSFRIIYESLQPDVIEVTDQLRVPGKIYRHTLKNGTLFVPEGVFLHDEYLSEPKRVNDTNGVSLSSSQADSNIKKSASKLPIQQVSEPQSEPHTWLIGMLLVSLAVVGALWALFRKTK